MSIYGGLALRKGAHTGDYSVTGTSYATMTTTNLTYISTIPVGWGLKIDAQCCCATTIGSGFVCLFDSRPTTALVATEIQSGTLFAPAALTWIVVGDGTSHTITLQSKVSSGTMTIFDSGADGIIPSMSLILEIYP